MPCHRRRLTMLWLTVAFAAELLAGGAKAECQHTKCGGVDIPYPFGIRSDNCAFPGFKIDCNDTKPFYRGVEVLNISIPLGQIRVTNQISSSCYNTTSARMDNTKLWELNLTGTPFMLSDSNKFTVIGCRTLAYIADKDYVGNYMSGCVSACRRGEVKSATNGTCSGIGCCQTPIPKGLDYYQVWFDVDTMNTSGIYNRTPCSYAVLMDNSNFNFSTTYLTSPMEFNNSYGAGQAPVVLDWAIRTANNCDEARKDPMYMCKSENSRCVNSSNGRGYICRCKEGYQGNPYLQGHNGCQDIDECNESYPCYGKCTNKDGGYDCTCPFGTRGNAYRGPCDKGLAIGICVSLLVALATLLGIEWIKYKQRIKRQDLMRKRDEYFHIHGGQLLIDMMNIESNVSFKLYTRDEIELATKGFDKMSIIGEGGQGTVHIGYNLDQDNNPVAIKKCKGFDENSRTEFTQELLILSRVNHDNIVKLLGCCLQFEVPVLVYEFVPNKTLHNLLHIQNDPSTRTLGIRLKVAADSAEALAYLHLLDHPILHGDVKSANILLSTNFIAKISDFGCSKIRAVNENDNMVKGTIGYLDPEYLLKFELTDKSDVYSFGVVLLELLTRRTPLSKDKVSLTSVFQEAMKEGIFLQLIDEEIMHEDNMGLIRELAVLASQCLVMAGESRPAMSRVAEELRRLERLVQQHHGELAGVSSFTLPASLAANTSECFTGEENTDHYSPMSIEFAR